jgi:hypothetical protein
LKEKDTMTRRKIWTAAVLATALGMSAGAALAEGSCPSVQMDGGHAGARAVLVLDHAQVLSLDGQRDTLGELDVYAQSHLSANGGTYILFRAPDASLHRLDSTAQVIALKESCAPMAALKAKMNVLHDQQKPLDERMHALGNQMKQANSGEERGQIGSQMSQLGQQMGELGQKEGDLGRQEGVLGRAFYDRLQALTDACLRNGSCPVVAKS